MKKYILIAVVISISFAASAQQIQWYSFEQALEMNEQRLQQNMPAKKIFADVYTDWCGWCRHMDATTFSNPEIAKYMQQNFINVKLNAERTDTVRINNQVFVNKNNPGGAATRRGAYHDLGPMLLRGQMSFPSFTILDENGQQLEVIPGYKDAKSFELILHFIGDNAYKTTKFDEYSKTFQGKVQ
jgi:thioredoxin-related protein